jgi:hypothetical protein
MLQMARDDLKDVAQVEWQEIPCFDPWLIGYSQPRSEHIAKASLEREGFECWYPIRKVVSTVPARKLPSKTRHRRRFEVTERVEPVLVGYLFIRRLRGSFDLQTAYELHGVGGLCRVGGQYASLQDHEIEIIRLAEADGKFNIYHETVPGPYRLSLDIDPRTYVGATTRDLGSRLDKSGEETVFTEKLGRVLRKVHALRMPRPV